MLVSRQQALPPARVAPLADGESIYGTEDGGADSALITNDAAAPALVLSWSGRPTVVAGRFALAPGVNGGLALPRYASGSLSSIAAKVEGLAVWNNTTHLPNFWDGSAWIAGGGGGGEPDVLCTAAELATTYAPSDELRGVYAYATDTGATYVCRRTASVTYSWVLVGDVPSVRTFAGLSFAANRSAGDLRTAMSVYSIAEVDAAIASASGPVGSGGLDDNRPTASAALVGHSYFGADIERLYVCVTDGDGHYGWERVTPDQAKVVLPLCSYATTDGPLTAVGRLRFDPSLYTIAGKTLAITFEAMADVSAGGLTGTVTLRNLTDASDAAMLTITSTTAGNSQSASVTVPGAAKSFELRVSVAGGAGYLTLGGAVLRLTWS